MYLAIILLSGAALGSRAFVGISIQAGEGFLWLVLAALGQNLPLFNVPCLATSEAWVREGFF